MDIHMPTKYAHTNLVAKDWRRPAAFYREVFGCVPVPPERDLCGEWQSKDRATFFKVIGADVETCLERAAHQKDAQIVAVIERMAAHYEPPGQDEKQWPESRVPR